MAKGKKQQVSKKKAAEGRGCICNVCYIKMSVQLTLDGGEEWLCERCGLRHMKSLPVEVASLLP